MADQVASLDLVIARIASRQHGVVATAQLAVAGIDKRAVLRRAQAGRLHRLCRGVYAVGHPGLSQEGRWMAAVLASGEQAVLSHRSAAALWGLLFEGGGVIDVTVPGLGSRPRRSGIRLYRSRSLNASAVARRQAIPVTTPARTIADLRRTVSPRLLRRAVRQAEVIGLDLGEGVEADQTRSELEHRFLRLCSRHHLPPPQANAQLGPFTVDFLWPRQRLIAETDGYRFHRGRQAFEDDRARDAELQLRGYRVIRITYRQLLDDPGRVAAILGDLLSVNSRL